MKKIALIMFVIVSFNLYSASDIINLVPLGDDLSILFTDLSRDFIPVINQNSVMGDVYGRAEMKDNKKFYINLYSIGLTKNSGVAQVLRDENSEWGFFLPLSDVVNSAIGDGDVKDYYDMTGDIFGLPLIKLGFGFVLPMDMELHFYGSYLPSISYGSIMSELSDLSLEIIDIGGKLRRPVLHDEGVLPGVSVGIHYSYSSFILGYTLGSISDLTGSGIELAGFGDLDLSGDFDVKTVTVSYGANLDISKTLGFFTPFVSLVPTFHNTTYNTSANLDAVLYESGTETELTSTVLNSGVDTTNNSFDLYCSTGFEIHIKAVTFHTGFAFNVQDLSLMSVVTAFRMEF